jgi:hypothetical protein
MKAMKKSGIFGGLALAVVAGVFLGVSLSQPARGDGEKGKDAAGPRYTVVQAGEPGLIVTDNQTNTLYFYMRDEDAEPGADLKLRGSIDLSLVGKAAIPPRPGKKK